MVADGTVDQTALENLAPTTGTPVQLTPDQAKAAQDYLAANWNITIQ
jgi:hypothetical protein